MKRLLRSIRQFLSELRCRNVYQVAVTYVVVGFFVIEGADLTLTRLGLPPWTVTLVIVLVGLGFPIALVMTWALEMTPEGVRVEEPEGSEETAPAPASSSLDLWVGASVLVLLLFGAWWVWGGLGEEGGAGQAEHEAIKVKARSIAVLPFEVSGSGAEEWRDGMVTTLSLNLDGAAGLRAIADRTVFAAWQKRDSAAIGASAREVLAVARDVGARYAVIGSAVQLGGDLRLAAEVHEATRGTQLGTVQVRGAPGRVTALSNRLTRKVLAVLLEKSEERVPSVDLASITTAFLPALKAYLAGERRLRAGEYEAAAENFETAVDQDSSFALAYARLGLTRDWLVQFEAGTRALRWAYKRSG
jgi:TolB-like protein